jgi:hypothetical protein
MEFTDLKIRVANFFFIGEAMSNAHFAARALKLQSVANETD